MRHSKFNDHDQNTISLEGRKAEYTSKGPNKERSPAFYMLPLRRLDAPNYEYIIGNLMQRFETYHRPVPLSPVR